MRLISRVYAAASVVVLAVAWLVGADARAASLPRALGCALGAAAIVVGLRRHAPARRTFWLCLLAAELCWGAASVLSLARVVVVAPDAYNPGAALFIPGYVALGWATIVALRAIGPTRPASLDAAIGTALAALALSPVVFHAVAQRGGPAILEALFPAWDLLLAVLLLRIAFSAWSRKRSVQLLAAATFLLLASDAVYFGDFFRGSTVAAGVLSLGYTASYLLYGAAALAPSMRRVPPRAVFAEDDVVGRTRTIVVMTFALVATPTIFGVDQMVEGDPKDVVLAGIGVVAVVLVVLQVVSVLRRLDGLRRRSEESEGLFRMVFDAAGVGISVGSDGIMSRTNPALQRMLGRSGAELGRMHFTEISHPEDVGAGPRVPRPGATYSFEKRVIRASGETMWAEVTLTAPPDDSFGIAVIEDITTRKQLEEELRQAQKMEAVGQLAGGVAHDFNNLMTAVGGYAELLRRELEEADATRRGYVDAIVTASDRAAELTRKLLAFSRRQMLQLAPTELDSIVRGFDSIVRRLLPESIAVEYRLERHVVARVDRAQFEQVLLNLAVNARDAMPQGGRLRISLRAGGATAELDVEDEGVGMSEATLLRIFEPFFTTKPVGQGTGLGLSTVDGIVAQLGGTIDVVSRLGAGTTFTIRLPRVIEHVEAEAEVDAAPLAAATAGEIMLVEDEEIVRRVTTEMLRSAGYTVTAVATAEDALTLLAGGVIPDALVSDVVMTGMDGPALVEAARRLVPDLAVLFVSGYSVEALGDRTTEVVLTKPFTPADLADRIERVRRTAVAA